MNNYPAMLWYLLLLLVGLSGGAGDILLYQWAKSSRAGWLVAALASWLVSVLLFGLLLKYGGRGLSVSFAMAAVLHIAMVLTWDFWFVGSRLNRLELAGLALAVVAVVVIEIGHSLNP